mmetsp:Transcript_22246/g.38153  ORF Transcript_22246/g.38153 Transcript_22246/m.38153 type:complete len:154 (+) Transcript_22246:177-638(+)|eukprot:CAMPEP_0183729344 /NCGR_PEP_ID=MMETSP0737-20130205/30031_1 /TAXON_ID=385413 /ORGANISM="Thalassiosira miniscula, Strain CCMP1093" /LENGTH=153 /DNA_ID=CAMNT_0025961497 /DNA_START=155 /DNA_END=616 /DNA_ORIENTATION=+
MSQIFSNEEAMLKQLEAMGMPPAMLANLTTEQKKQMFVMTSNPDVIAKAQERVVHEEDWKKENGYEWKNSRDDVFVKVQVSGGVNKDVEKKGVIKCTLEENHMRVAAGNHNIIDKDLFQAINVKESKWEVKGDTLVVALRKVRAPMRWLSVFR